MTALVAGAVVFLLAAAPTALADGFGRCSHRVRATAGVPGMTCQTVRVPVDRSGRVPGEIALQVTRLPARVGPNSGAVVGLAGGPGEAATPELADFESEMEP